MGVPLWLFMLSKGFCIWCPLPYASWIKVEWNIVKMAILSSTCSVIYSCFHNMCVLHIWSEHIIYLTSLYILLIVVNLFNFNALIVSLKLYIWLIEYECKLLECFCSLTTRRHHAAFLERQGCVSQCSYIL